MRRIYLDNAATSFPKPNVVHDTVDNYNRNLGTPVGRGAYRQAVEIQRTVDRCRQRAAELFGVESPERIIFTFNGTDSLNLALQGLLEPGDHVVTTVIEHNSVLRPLRELQDRIGIDVTHVAADESARVDPADVRNAIRPETKLVAVVQASNVTGTIQPIDVIGEITRKAGAIFLVDAAQSAGHVPIDVSNSPIDLLACPGHKGLLGPLGTGLLYIRPGLETQLRSVRQGGTGSNSEDDRQPETLPDKYESGNHNTPGLVGLEAALGWLHERGLDSIRNHERELTARLIDGLAPIAGLDVFGPCDVEQQLGVVSLSLPELEPQIFAALLDENFGLQTRAGLHCAPGVHRCLGTFDQGGTVRLSVGPFTTADDIDLAVTAVGELAGSL
jgi:cysteine desulfurase/selenocysteine lyase